MSFLSRQERVHRGPDAVSVVREPSTGAAGPSPRAASALEAPLWGDRQVGISLFLSLLSLLGHAAWLFTPNALPADVGSLWDWLLFFVYLASGDYWKILLGQFALSYLTALAAAILGDIAYGTRPGPRSLSAALIGNIALGICFLLLLGLVSLLVAGQVMGLVDY